LLKSGGAECLRARQGSCLHGAGRGGALGACSRRQPPGVQAPGWLCSAGAPPPPPADPQPALPLPTCPPAGEILSKTNKELSTENQALKQSMQQLRQLLEQLVQEKAALEAKVGCR
jgi:hypothetical protein